MRFLRDQQGSDFGAQSAGHSAPHQPTGVSALAAFLDEILCKATTRAVRKPSHRLVNLPDDSLVHAGEWARERLCEAELSVRK